MMGWIPVTSKKSDRLLGETAWGVYLASLDSEAEATTLAGQQEGTQRDLAPGDPRTGVQALSPEAGATVAGLGQECW